MAKTQDATSDWIKAQLAGEPTLETQAIWERYQGQGGLGQKLGREAFAVKVSRVRARVQGVKQAPTGPGMVPVPGDSLRAVVEFFKRCVGASFGDQFYELAQEVGITSSIARLETIVEAKKDANV